MRLPSCQGGNGYCVSPQPLAFGEPLVTMVTMVTMFNTPIFIVTTVAFAASV